MLFVTFAWFLISISELCFQLNAIDSRAAISVQLGAYYMTSTGTEVSLPDGKLIAEGKYNQVRLCFCEDGERLAVKSMKPQWWAPKDSVWGAKHRVMVRA